MAMTSQLHKTWNAKPGEITRRWYVVDAEGQTLGPAGDAHRRRPARQGQADLHAARRHRRLRRRRQRREDPGHRQQARPEDVPPPLRLSRRAAEPHAARAARAPPDRGASARRSRECFRETSLARAQIGKLKIYAGPEHPHEAQSPEALELSSKSVWRPMSDLATYRGTGKRKTSVARVILRPGDGTTWFNGRNARGLLPAPDAPHAGAGAAPRRRASRARYDVRVRVHGGGPSGQAGRGPPRHRPRARRGEPGACARC